MLSSGSEAANNFGFLIVAPATKDLIEHLFNKGGNLGYNLEEKEDMALRARILGKKKAAEDKLAKQALDPVLAFPSLVEVQSNILSSQ